MVVVESCQEPLQVTRALLGPDQRAEISLNRVITQLFRMFIRRSKSLRRPIDTLVCQHRVEGSTQTAGCSHGQKRLEGLWWPVVMRVAVGERQSANTLR